MADEPPIVLVDAVSPSTASSPLVTGGFHPLAITSGPVSASSPSDAGWLVTEVPEDIPEFEADCVLPLLSVTGTSPHMAYAEMTLPSLTVEGKSGHSFAIELPSLSVEAIATPADIASGDFSLPSLTATGKTGWQLSFKLPLPDIAGEILSGGVASGKLRLPLLEVTGVAENGFTASGSFSLPRLSATVGISESRAITGTITIPLLQVTGTILMGQLAEADITLPLITLDANAYEQGTAQGDVTLPLLQVAGHIAEAIVIVELDGTTSSLTGYALAINVENDALSEYTNFVFNSFADFQGHILAAGDNGIFELTGDMDNETDIDSVIRTNMTDGGVTYLKRPEDVYIGATSDDELQANVIVDGNVKHEGVAITGRSENVETRKTKIGKGAKSLFWAVEVENISGCNFSIDSIELVLKPVERKI
jgi:hypothetical protein